MINSFINFYRNVNFRTQRTYARILFTVINMPAVGHIYHFIYMRHIKTQSKQFPQKLIIETCNYCNLRCVMCPYKAMTRAKTTMGMLLYRKIIDDAVSLGITEVTISGYLEPLLDKFLFERIQYAKSKRDESRVFE